MENLMKSIFFKHIKLNMLAITFIILTSATQILSSVMLMNLLNSTIEGDVELLIKTFIYIIILWIGVKLFDFISGILMSKSIKKMNNDIRNRIGTNISNMQYEKFYENEIGTYVSWFTNDINQIEKMSFNPIYTIVYKVSSLIFAFIAILNIHYSLVLTTIITTFILILTPKIFSKKISKGSSKLSEDQETFTKNIKDILSGFNVIKTHNIVNIFMSTITDSSEFIESSKFKFSYMQQKYSSIIGLINILCQFSCVFIASMLAINNVIAFGALLSIGNLVGVFFNSVQGVSQDLMSITAGKTILNKFKSIEKESSYSFELDEFKECIELQKVSYKYDDKNILEDINLKFEKGKKYAIVGPSGCGKSTILKLIMGQLTNFEGSIYIDNKNINDYDIKSIYNNFAYIDQNVYLFDTTICNNITLFSENYDIHRFNQVLTDSSLNDYVNNTEAFNYIVGEDGKNLSGGQKQRIAIARALFNKKSVIIMDEGTSALDKKNSYLVENKLLENPNITLILVSHNIQDELKSLFDDIYTIGDLCVV